MTPCFLCPKHTCVSELECTFELLHTACAFMTFYHTLHLTTDVRAPGNMLPSSPPGSKEIKSMAWAHKDHIIAKWEADIKFTYLVHFHSQTTGFPIICVGEFRSDQEYMRDLTPKGKYWNISPQTPKACLQRWEQAYRGSWAHLHRQGCKLLEGTPPSHRESLSDISKERWEGEMLSSVQQQVSPF